LNGPVPTGALEVEVLVGRGQGVDAPALKVSSMAVIRVISSPA
jgi:hypothetical protein